MILTILLPPVAISGQWTEIVASLRPVDEARRGEEMENYKRNILFFSLELGGHVQLRRCPNLNVLVLIWTSKQAGSSSSSSNSATANQQAANAEIIMCDVLGSLLFVCFFFLSFCIIPDVTP